MSKSKDINILKSLQAEVKELKSLVILLNEKNDSMEELLNLIHYKVSDLSCKVDEEASTINLVKSTNKKIKSVSKSQSSRKNKMNIMTYFKNKYRNTPEVFDEIISKEDLERLWTKYEREISSKKKNNVETYKLTLIYRNFLKKDKSKPNDFLNDKVKDSNLKFVKNLREQDEQKIEEEIDI